MLLGRGNNCRERKREGEGWSDATARTDKLVSEAWKKDKFDASPAAPRPCNEICSNNLSFFLMHDYSLRFMTSRGDVK